MLEEVLPSVISGAVLGVGGYLWGTQRLALRRRVQHLDAVQIFIEHDPEIIYANTPNWVSFPYFIPGRTPADLPPPPRGSGKSWWSWAKQLQGEPSGFDEMQVTITAWEDLRVVVDALRVEVLSTGVEPPGTTVMCPVGGASLVNRQLDIRLSTFASTVTPRQAGSGEPSEPFAFHLGPGELSRFSLWVSPAEGATEDWFKWRATLDLLVNNTRRSVEISDSGSPFVLHRRGFHDGLYLPEGDRWVHRAL